MKYFQVAERLLSDESFKSQCIKILEQIISAEQMPSNTKLEQRIQDLETELTHLLQQPYDCLHSLLLQPGALFSKEQMQGESTEILKAINESWAAITKIKQNLDTYESTLRERYNITEISHDNPLDGGIAGQLAWCADMKNKICMSEAQIKLVCERNNELNKVIWAEESAVLPAGGKKLDAKGHLLFLV